MGVYIPSEEELQAGGSDFTLLPEDIYVVEVTPKKLKDVNTPVTVEQPNPYNKTEAFPGGVPRPVLQVAMKVISFANGDPLFDDNGDEVTDERYFFGFLDTTKVGLKPQPSGFRKFLAAAFGKKVEESINIDSWEELVGKRMLVTMKHNKGKHKVVDYQPQRSRRRAAEAPAEAATETTSNDTAMADKAKEVFGEDAPAF